MNNELKDIPEFTGLYAATSDGRIYSYRRKRFMKIVNGNKGYKQVCLQKDAKQYMRYVHRLVASAWLPNPDNLPEINHKDENKGNNDISNLEWCTHQHNIDCRTNIGVPKRAIYCIELDRAFESIAAAAREFGVDAAHMHAVCNHPTHTAKGYHFRYLEERRA